MFEAAGAAFKAKGSGGLLLSPAQYAPYVSLALGSALALFMYPHAMTGILASASADTIRKNAMLLPAYSVALTLIARMGLMGHAAGLKLSNNNDVVQPGSDSFDEVEVNRLPSVRYSDRPDAIARI